MKKLFIIFIISFFYINLTFLFANDININNEELDENFLSLYYIKGLKNNKFKNEYEKDNYIINNFYKLIKNKNNFNIEKDLNNNIDILEKKIETNKRLNYNLAVKRDNLKINLLKNRINFSNLLKILHNDYLMYFPKEKILEDIDKYKIKLSNEFLKNYNNYYNQIKNDTTLNEVGIEFIKNYELLKEEYSYMNFIITNIEKNIDKIIIKNNFNIKSINDIINNINNSNLYIENINFYLKNYLNITLGNLSILIFYIIISFIIYYLFKKFINKIFIKYISNFNIEEELFIYIKKIINKYLKILFYIVFIDIFFRLYNYNNLNYKQFDIFQIIYLIYFIFLIYKTLDFLILNYSENLFLKYPSIKKEMISFLLKSVKVILFFITLLIVLSKLGFDIKALLASLGVGGIAVALASKDTLSNLFGSITIMLDNSFSQGDWIETDKYEGTVVEIRMRTTTIRTFDNALVTIPNSNLSNMDIKNYNKRKIGRRIKLNIGITYESNFNDIKKALNDIRTYLKENKNISTDNLFLENNKSSKLLKKEDELGIKKNLLVFLDNYNNSSIDILIYCFSKSVEWEEWLRVKEEVLFEIENILTKNNLEFAYPTIKNHIVYDKK